MVVEIHLHGHHVRLEKVSHVSADRSSVFFTMYGDAYPKEMPRDMYGVAQDVIGVNLVDVFAYVVYPA